MVMEPVLTKADFYRRFDAGEFGNHGPMWETFDEYKRSSYPGLIAIRTRYPGGPCKYNLDLSDAKRFHLYFSRGYFSCGLPIPDDQLHFSAMCPTSRLKIQGEVCRYVGGLRLVYTQVRKPMRDALQQNTQHASGISAKRLLDFYLNSRSREWMDHLLDEYPDHVVEFSAFDRCWGVIPGHNCVIWEVRKY